MFIQTEETPNPATLKFLPGQTLIESGSAEFTDVSACENSPLAQRLFGLQGVSGVFIGRDFVSVSKADDTDWSMLKPMVLATLMEHLSTGQAVLLKAPDEADANGDDDEIVVQIKELIAERVRPMVMMDGGDIVFDSFQSGIVYLKMQGACSGCPSSTATLKMGIENMLQHFIPEVLEVRPVPD
jgi:Fe-S cluster biogenesis protein NfuA